jgi:putative ATP-dependent endonuclease of the OLD family
MRLKSLSLKNFRCFTDETVSFDLYTALVGANNAGKSAVVAAIDIFFRSNPKNIPISVDDFFKRDLTRELEITLTFTDLTEPAQNEFAHYVRSGELTFFIKATVDESAVRASLHGIRLANPDFAEFFEKGSAKDKRIVYEALQTRFALPKWQSQDQAAEALRIFENENSGLNKPIPSEDKAFGVEGPIPRLRQFIDFVYIPAVKDAGDEAIEARNTAFSRLVDRAVRAKLKIDERINRIREDARTEIDAMATDHQEILTTLADRIDLEYRKFNSSDSKLHLEWGVFDDKNLQINLPAVHLEVSDDLIRNTIGKFGHGTQRNYLMALLMVSAAYDFTDLQTIIIACEEPELYQHPPQARILANALYALASNQAQVILTTHSLLFVTAKSFENIRLVRRTHSQRSRTHSWSVDQNCAAIANAKGQKPIGNKAALATINQFLQPQINEMFFAQCVVFVEGDEDRSILTKYLQLCGKYTNLLTMGMHIVPTNGKGNMLNAIAIANGFEIPFFAIFDGDMNPGKSEDIKLNKDILAIIKYEGVAQDGSVSGNVFEDKFCIWKDCLQATMTEFVDEWDAQKEIVCHEFGWTVDRLQKNPMVLEATLERVYKGKPIAHLDKLCSALFKRFGPHRVTAQ